MGRSCLAPIGPSTERMQRLPTVGEVEIEFQPIGAIRAGSNKGVSDAIFNFGFADKWELVLQGTAQALPEGLVRSVSLTGHS